MLLEVVRKYYAKNKVTDNDDLDLKTENKKMKLYINQYWIDVSEEKVCVCSEKYFLI